MGTATPPEDARATATVAKDVVTGIQTLVRQELELARLELLEGVSAKAQAAGLGGAAGVIAAYAFGFLGLAAGFGLANVVATWLAFLIVAGSFLLLTAILLLVARQRAGSAPIAPEQTKARLQEDVAWARQLLRR